MGSTHVNIGNIQNAINNVGSLMGAMETFMNNAENAANEALEAVGGPNTDVGKSLLENIVDVNKADFDRAKTNAENMVENAKTVLKTYLEAQGNVVSTIQSYKNA